MVSVYNAFEAPLISGYSNEVAGSPLPAVALTQVSAVRLANVPDLNYPPTIENGDTLLIFATTDVTGGANIWITPTGWTLLSHVGNGTSDSTLTIFQRLADGTETGSIAVSSATNFNRILFMAKVTNIDTVVQTDVIGNMAFANSTSINAPSITTLNDNSLVFAASTYDGGDFVNYNVTPLDYIKQLQVGIEAGIGVGMVLYTRLMPTAGATGAATFSIDGPNDGILAMQIALKLA